jgi:two-component system NtrC family sensor kinase
VLRTKLFVAFAAVIAIFSLLAAVLATHTIKQQVTGEAQQRVRLDLSSAWAVLNSRQREVETILRLVASKQIVVASAGALAWQDPEVLSRLTGIRVRFGFDFLNILSPEGQVMVRTTAPTRVGDYHAADPMIARAIEGKVVSAITLLEQPVLQQENGDLAERAFLEIEATPRARRTVRQVEDRGMAMVAAVPIMSGNRVVGIAYGGILMNRNSDLIDNICNVVFRNEKYGDQDLGTATIFLHDSRIATTVRRENGNRALGTRVSKEVADQVLDNGKPWVGEAFVVRDWYISAYDPIRDIEGKTIGMLYVGILRAPFDAYGRSIVLRYLVLTVFVLLIALAVAFVTAGRLAQPIHRLVEAAVRTSNGDGYQQVPTGSACRETDELIHAFNTMSMRLLEREESLKALNRSYMETLGFVSHELKSPLATMMNYVFLLKQRKIGDLTDKQLKAVITVESNLRRLVEMVRHYLNLSRIENGELTPVRTKVAVLSDIVAPLLESAEDELGKRRMNVENRIPEDVTLDADINMAREVFENLIGNAIKYGREEGTIILAAEARDGMVEFRVRNDGEGISEEGQGQIFGKFARLGQAAAGKPRGTGLGLFIAKRIITAHGGKIDVSSEQGRWIEFAFTLPRLREEQERSNG